MKLDNLDKKYTKIAFFVIFTFIIIKLIDSTLGHVPVMISMIWTFLTELVHLLLPVIFALCIAYILNSPVRALEKFFKEKMHFKKKGLSRGLALCITHLATLGIICGIFLGIYYMIGGQLSKSTSLTAMYNYVVNYIKDGRVDTNKLTEQIQSLNIPFLNEFSGNIQTFVGFLQNILNSLIQGMVSTLVSLGSNLLNIVIAFILSIYLIYSKEYFLSLYRKLFYVVFRESRIGKAIRRCLGVFNYTFSNYIRGQLIEASFVAILISVVLVLVGVDYAIVIGIITGILNLIPYIGAFIGVLLATIMGLFTGGPWMAALAFVATEAVQQLDANVLCPRIVGNKVGVHPAFILVAITIGGSICGLLGMLLAVPVTASFITLFRIWYENNVSGSYQRFKQKEDEEIADILHQMETGEYGRKKEPAHNDAPKDDTPKTVALVKSIKDDIEGIMSEDEGKK